MSRRLPLPLGLPLALALAVATLGCGGPASVPPELCRPCAGDSDCGASGNRCLEIGGVAACGVDCGAAACPAGYLCATITGGGRNCIPTSGQCPAPCNGGCAAGHTCDVAQNTCVPTSGDAGAQQDAPAQVDAGRPHVGPWPDGDGAELDLGDVGQLRFTVVSDTQPPTTNGPVDTGTVGHIMQLMNAQGPRFGVHLGDYLDAYPASYTVASSQLQQFIAAQARFTPELYYTLGNHDSYGANLQAYWDLMTRAHYYVLRMQTPQGSVKIVFLADNRWEANYQKPWAETQLARATTYTFIAHHYPSWSSEEPTSGDLPATLNRYPVTLEMAGHHHRYDYADRVVTLGIGGGELAGSDQHHGFVTIDVQTDGKVKGTAYREDTGAVMDTFTVTP